MKNPDHSNAKSVLKGFLIDKPYKIITTEYMPKNLDIFVNVVKKFVGVHSGLTIEENVTLKRHKLLLS